MNFREEKHLSEEQLVLHYYGEGDGAGEHLDTCDRCRAEYQRIQRTLNAVDSLPVPERPEDYGTIVWRRISPRLSARPRRWFFHSPGLKWAMAAALLLCAFLVGRYGQRPAVQAPRPGSAERILLVAVGDHLERSEMVLAEIANSGEPGKGKLDISYERKLAEDLVEANRLYRVSADTTGDRATSSLLDDLERVLLEIAHGPAELTSGQVQDLKRDIQDRGLLFKVRVYQTKIQDQGPTI